MDPTVETIAKDIKERLAAVDQRTSDEAIGRIVTAAVAAAFDKGEFARKISFTADPRLAGSKYGRLGLGVSDIEMLHSILTTAKQIGKSRGPSEDLEKAFSAVSDGRYMDATSAKAADTHQLERAFGDGQLDAKAFQQGLLGLDRMYSTRAMDTQETGYGLELIGVQYVSDLWAAARTASRVFSLLPTFPMTAPTAYLPVSAAPPEMLHVAESLVYNASNYTTSKTGSNRVAVTAEKFVIHQMWSGEMEEDSIIPYLPFLRAQAAESIGFYTDSLVLNGDTTDAGTGNINLHDANPADTKHYLAFDGIRHAALVDNTGNAQDCSGAMDYDKIFGLRSKLVDPTYFQDWGHPASPEDLVYVVDPVGADELAMLDEVISIDKYGPLATVLTGELAKIGRNPVIPSAAMSLTEADGFVSTTAVNNVKHQIACFNRRAFIIGWRRQLRVETERIIGTDQSRIVFSLRLGFGRFTPTGAAAGIEGAAVLYNIT